MSLEIRGPRGGCAGAGIRWRNGRRHTAVVRAIEERLARTPRRRAADEETAIEALFDRLAQLPVFDRRSPDEIIGYGPNGRPH